MDGARNHLLAGPRFAVYEHSRGSGRNLLYGLADRHHGWRLCNQAVEVRTHRYIRLRGGLPTAKLLLGALEAGDHVVHLERFGEIVEYAAFHRLHRCIDGGVGGKEDHRHIGSERLYFAEKRHPIHRRHSEVGDGDVDSAIVNDIKRARAVTSAHYLISIRLQKALKEKQYARFIVNNKDF